MYWGSQSSYCGGEDGYGIAVEISNPTTSSSAANTSDQARSSKPEYVQRLKAPPGIKSMFYTINPLGGDTFAFIVVGAAEAGRFATNAKVLASSMINLSERFSALPKDT